MRESIPRQADRKSRVSEEERWLWGGAGEGGSSGSGTLKEEIGVWNSQGGGKDKRPFPPAFLSISHLGLPL